MSLRPLPFSSRRSLWIDGFLEVSVHEQHALLERSAQDQPEIRRAHRLPSPATALATMTLRIPSWS